MNKRKALKECIKMWDWLADNKSRHKGAYFIRSNVTWVSNDCYACEYKVEHGISCSECIIKNWNTDTCTTDWGAYEAPCLSNSSPYRLWVDIQDPFLKRHYAKQISILAQKSLNDLKWYEGWL